MISVGNSMKLCSHNMKYKLFSEYIIIKIYNFFQIEKPQKSL